ncbi:MAG: 5,10-methylenetetrahydrofolate reductase, partial [Thalassolituus oleivorans]
DIQDESSRTNKPRPFPFMQTFDPCAYSRIIREKSGHPVITYKSVAQRNASDFSDWLTRAWNEFGVRDIVLVGAPSSEGDIRLSLPEAYKVLATHEAPYHLGGVTIAERHAAKGNEHTRLLNKGKQGCTFFISQAVYDANATIDLLTSYAKSCAEQGVEPQRIILTFTPCGSLKTLEFMEWLGISVPESTRQEMMAAEDPLAESIKICHNNLQHILAECLPLNLPLGLNIESLTNRKTEIDASIELFTLLKKTLDTGLEERRKAS